MRASTWNTAGARNAAVDRARAPVIQRAASDNSLTGPLTYQLELHETPPSTTSVAPVIQRAASDNSLTGPLTYQLELHETPPSTTSVAPVIQRAASDNRNSTASATS